MAEFKEKWTNRLEALFGDQPLSGIRNQDTFKALAVQLVQTVVDDCFDVIPNQVGGKKRDEMKSSILKSITEGDDGFVKTRRYTVVVDSYVELHSRYVELSSIFAQTRKADIEEKRRLLLYRILTAISMGGILLGTYAIADYFGIPMPLRMISIPTQ